MHGKGMHGALALEGRHSGQHAIVHAAEGINIGEKVIVFNALGAKVKEVNANASNISLHVSKGIYIVRAADQATKVIVK